MSFDVICYMSDHGIGYYKVGPRADEKPLREHLGQYDSKTDTWLAPDSEQDAIAIAFIYQGVNVVWTCKHAWDGSCETPQRWVDSDG